MSAVIASDEQNGEDPATPRLESSTTAAATVRLAAESVVSTGRAAATEISSVTNDEDDLEYHDTEDPTMPPDNGSVPADEEDNRDDAVEATSQGTVLPVASLVQPPPELLERLRQLEANQSNPNIPIAIPHDMEDTKNVAWRKLWLVAAWLVSIAVVAVVVDVALGSSSKADSGSEATSPTASPSSQSLAELKDLISNVSLDQGASLRDESSPQFTALMWLHGNSNIETYPDWKRLQRYTLAVFYNSLNGDDWKKRDGWLSDDEECSWLTLSKLYPVCNEYGNYHQISLAENNLEGTLPLELVLLSNSLNRLDLKFNNIRGTIPTEVGLLTNLGFFSLYHNLLTGALPKEISLFRGIGEFSLFGRRFRGQGIEMAFNHLTGLIPPAIFEPPELRALDLSNNLLSGSIPTTTIGQATNLIALVLYNSGLTGFLPTELGKLSLLEAFRSDRNNHTGSIPSELGLCTNLWYLGVDRNPITGALPSEVGSILELEELWTYDTMITGQIPSEIGRLSLLEILVMRSSNLTGPLPRELGNLESLRFIDLQTNNISGSIPSTIGHLTNLEGIWLDHNKISGVIPSEFGLCESLDILILDTNEALRGALPVELTNVPLSELTIGGTNMGGTLPTEIGLWTTMTAASFEANGLSGSLPTELGLMTALLELYVSGLSMSGTLPSEVGHLSQLEVLQFTNATIEGNLPPEVGNLSNLVQLNIINTSVTVPISEGITGFLRLKSLSLESSQVVGQIPPSLADLASSLEILALANNSLTGMVPSEILMLTNLDTLRLYDNNLTGPFACPDFIEECLVSCGIVNEPSCRILEKE